MHQNDSAEEHALEFQPMPGDEQFVTRGEWRRMNMLHIYRVQRIEGLCFDDVRDGDGKMVRPSLESLLMRAWNHIDVMCSWAHGTVRLAKLVGALSVIGGCALFLWHFVARGGL